VDKITKIVAGAGAIGVDHKKLILAMKEHCLELF